MTIDRAVFLFAGVFILTGVVLAWLVSPWFLIMPAFAGVNMIQAQFTGFCPSAWAFGKLGLKPGAAFV